MNRPPSRGFLYYCQFPKNGFTSATGRQLVVVLVPEYVKGKESLVAFAWQKGEKWGVGYEHVYTVLHGRLEENAFAIDEGAVKKAKQSLADKIKSAD
ncbi:Uncharacterised protein [Amycolatopsis camponoti]|uniref:Uncharacterized protein n=1 Tax=Amycolatopsis camponoti TaxID=2606593 RepID=A0A6I8LQ29_9PSEU|nr:hypothetical protein [Amycolatopsis camponoti]VVJ17249.1 Uncharacterised protein [Amycolatopsis camponoti]